MRERSHKKGELYQQDVKHWLSRVSFLGFETEFFGDAYDVTKKACTIGEVVFDFSLKLRRGSLTRHILYAECKYRDERKGNVNDDFQGFVGRASEGLAKAEPDDADSATFVFLSNIPPDSWREYLKDKRKFCRQVLTSRPGPFDEQVLDRLIQRVHLVVLSAQIIARV